MDYSYLDILSNEEIHRRARSLPGQPLRLSSDSGGQHLFHLIRAMNRLLPEEMTFAQRLKALANLGHFLIGDCGWYALQRTDKEETIIEARGRLHSIWWMLVYLKLLQIEEDRVPETEIPGDPNPIEA